MRGARARRTQVGTDSPWSTVPRLAAPQPLDLILQSTSPPRPSVGEGVEKRTRNEGFSRSQQVPAAACGRARGRGAACAAGVDAAPLHSSHSSPPPTPTPRAGTGACAVVPSRLGVALRELQGCTLLEYAIACKCTKGELRCTPRHFDVYEHGWLGF
eukprot:2172879-Pleurochrysis_carterae.AAC.1